MKIDLVTEGLLDRRRFNAWRMGTHKAIHNAVARAMRDSGKLMAERVRGEMRASFRTASPKFLRSLHAKVFDHKADRLPALYLGSKVPWLGVHERGGTIRGRMLIPLLPQHRRIGRRAFALVIDALLRSGNAYFIEKNGQRDRRFRIEHAQHLTREAIPRFAQLGVIPSMQPYHAIDDGRWAEKRIGPERIKTTYPFRSLLDAGAPLTFGSDWTVAPLNPLEGIYAAVTRRTLDGANPGGWVPQEKISVEEALRCYTDANAYAGFQEDKLGKLKEGHLADFVILSDNLFEIPPEQIKDVEVVRTVVNGEAVYVR